MTDVPPSSATAPRGPYQNGIRRRREIIESASRVFASYGFASGSLRKIAEEVGVTPATLTRHFGNKEGLLFAVLAKWDRDAEIKNPPDLRGLDYFVRLRDAVIDNQANRGLIELFLTLSAESTNASHPARDFIQARYRHVVATGVQHLRAVRDAGETVWMDDEVIAAEVRSVFATMDGLQLQWLLDPGIDLVGDFSHALSGYLERWTGRPGALPRLEDRGLRRPDRLTPPGPAYEAWTSCRNASHTAIGSSASVTAPPTISGPKPAASAGRTSAGTSRPATATWPNPR
jgi:AcrR family transcriptional regulator